MMLVDWHQWTHIMVSATELDGSMLAPNMTTFTEGKTTHAVEHVGEPHVCC